MMLRDDFQYLANNILLDTPHKQGLNALNQYSPQTYKNSLNLIFNSNLYAFSSVYDCDKDYKTLFYGLLSSPLAYQPPCIWALFWAVIKAEYEFMLRFIPCWSHEERLTGYLVSQLITRLEDFQPYWMFLGNTWMDKKPYCSISYFDTATNQMEAKTGSDLGLIIHAKYPNQPEFFKTIRFQVKKAENQISRINLNQANILMQAKNYGYYLFFHRNTTEFTLSPTVLPASDLNKNSNGKITLKQNVKNKGFDFATFITFGLADSSSNYGILTSNPDAALNYLTIPFTSPKGERNRSLPSRLLILTLGEIDEYDWSKSIESKQVY